MDKGLKALYGMVYGLDIDKCHVLPLDVNKQNIYLLEDKITLADFIKKHSQLVLVSAVSTEEMCRKVNEKFDAPEQFKNMLAEKFVSVTINHLLISYLSKSIGAVNQYFIHNGFPLAIKTEDLVGDITNVNDVFNAGMEKMSKSNPLLMAGPVEKKIISQVYLLREFIDQTDFYTKEFIEEVMDNKFVKVEDFYQLGL